MFKKIVKKVLRKLGIMKTPPPVYNPAPGASIFGDVNLVKVGKSVSFGGNVIIYANAEVSFGDNTMVALNVVFHTSTHDYTSHPMWHYRIDRPISVGRHVWIGLGAIILPGVIIEDYAVIAAGAVVTGNVPKGAIVGGNPARIIKYRDKGWYEKEMSLQDNTNAYIKKEGFLEVFCKEK